MEEDTSKEIEEKGPVGKDNIQSKEENEEMTKNLDINIDTQINTMTTMVGSEPRDVVSRSDDSQDAKLSFLHTAKLKAKTSLQGDSWLYNKIMVLKKKMGVMQKELDVECTKRNQVEVQIGNIPEKLKEYE